MVNAGKWCVKIKSGGDANILLLNFYVLPALSSQLSVVSKLCIMNALLHFLLLLCQSCHCLRSVSFGGRILDLIKVPITVGWVWWRHKRGPLFSLASSPPTLNTPLLIANHFLCSCVYDRICMDHESEINYYYYIIIITNTPISLRLMCMTQLKYTS